MNIVNCINTSWFNCEYTFQESAKCIITSNYVPKHEMTLTFLMFLLLALVLFMQLIHSLYLKIPENKLKTTNSEDIYQINDPIFGMGAKTGTPAYPSISKPSLGLQIAIFILIAIFIAFPLGNIIFG